ncbi:MAG: hypothetical protein AABW87_01950 [Nanoarchaeota archaeon]
MGGTETRSSVISGIEELLTESQREVAGLKFIEICADMILPEPIVGTERGMGSVEEIMERNDYINGRDYDGHVIALRNYAISLNAQLKDCNEAIDRVHGMDTTKLVTGVTRPGMDTTKLIGKARDMKNFYLVILIEMREICKDRLALTEGNLRRKSGRHP